MTFFHTHYSRSSVGGMATHWLRIKPTLRNVVNDLNTSSSSLLHAVSAGGPILPWEQQLLFAVAMLVSALASIMSLWQWPTDGCNF